MSSTDVLIYVDVVSNKQSSFSSQIHTPSFSINCPSLVSTARSLIILWRLWSHKPSHKHDSNKYQSNAFVICDHKSDETRSVTHENKAYLVWLMFPMLSNQHYPHRANQKRRSWAKAVFQKRGVCGQAVPSFPSPSPSAVILFFFFCSCLSFLDEPREETLATQANLYSTKCTWKFFQNFAAWLRFKTAQALRSAVMKISWISNFSKDDFVKKSLPFSTKRKLSILLNFLFPSVCLSGVHVFWTFKCETLVL